MEDTEPIESTEGAKAESQHQCSTSSHTNSSSKGLKENGKTLTVRRLEGVQVPGAADVPNGVTACSASDTSASKPRGLEEDGLKDTITDGKHLEEEAVCNDDVSVNKHTTGVCVNKDTTDVCVNKETTDLCVYKHTTGVCVNKDTTDVFVNKETTDLCVNKDTTDLCVNKDTRSCKASNYLHYDNDREKLSILSYPDEKSNLDNQCTDYKKYGLEMNDITKEDNAGISEESAQTDKKYLDHSFHKSCKFNYETQTCPVSNDPNEAPSVTESHDTNDPTNLDNDVISLDDVRNIDAITNITDTNIEPDGEYRVSNGEETVDQQRPFYGQRGDIVDLDAANRGNGRHIEWGPMENLHPPCEVSGVNSEEEREHSESMHSAEMFDRQLQEDEPD